MRKTDYPKVRVQDEEKAAGPTTGDATGCRLKNPIVYRRRYPEQKYDINELVAMRKSGMKTGEIASAKGLRKGLVIRSLAQVGCNPSRQEMTWARWGDLGDIEGDMKRFSGSWRLAAQARGVDPFSFRAYLQAHNIPFVAHPRSGYVAKRCTDAHDREILALRKQGLSLGSISDRLHVRLGRVRAVTSEHKLSASQAFWTRAGTDAQIKERLAHAGSAKALAKELGIGADALRRRMTLLGLSSPVPNRQRRGTIDPVWTRMRYEGGSSLNYLSERQDVEMRKIRKFLDDEGITRPADVLESIRRRKTGPHSAETLRKIIRAKHPYPLKLEHFQDMNKLRFLLLQLSRMERYRPRNGEERQQFLDKFYFNLQFSSLFCEWSQKKKIKDFVPSLDHITPLARGGSHEIDNLQFLTWWENKCKHDRTHEEWTRFINDHKLQCDLLAITIRRSHRECECCVGLDQEDSGNPPNACPSAGRFDET